MGQDSSLNPIASGLEAFGKTSYYGDEATKQQQENIDAAEAGLKALEDRYAQPNWFKVAAGFAKPQLGGFIASLGSASNALGDWQEQQRANEIPIYNARAQLGYMQSQQAHRRSAEKLFRQGAEKGFTNSMVTEIMGHDDKELGPKALEIYKQQQANLTGGNEAVKAAAELARDYPPDISRQAVPKIRTPDETPGLGLTVPSNPVNRPTAPTDFGANYSLANNPAAASAGLVTPPNPMPTPTTVAKPTQPTSDGSLINVNSGAGGVSPKVEQATKEAMIAKTHDVMDQNNASLDAAKKQATILHAMYPLVNSDGMDLVLGRTTNGSLAAQLQIAAMNNKLPSFITDQVANYVPKWMEIAHPGLSDRVRELLNLQAQQLLAVNNATVNPTANIKSTEASAGFNMDDTRESANHNILTKLHELKRPFELADLYQDMSKNGVDYRNINTDKRYSTIDQEWLKRHNYLRTKPADATLPTDLSPDAFVVRPHQDILKEIEARNQKRKNKLSPAEQIRANAQQGG